MASTQETRRINLKRLISEHEGMNNLARKLGLTKGAYLSQLLSNPPIRELSEKTCRRWEVLLKLPEGWMDGQPKAYAAPGKEQPLDTVLLTKTLVAVTEALKEAKVSLSPQRLADLVAMQYADAVTTGLVDKGRIGTIVGLLKA